MTDFFGEEQSGDGSLTGWETLKRRAIAAKGLKVES